MARAEKTAVYNLETGEIHEHLAWMGYKEIAERVFGVVETASMVGKYEEISRLT